MIRKMILFTNRNCMIFSENGKQVAEAQAAIDCYHVDAEKALAITREAAQFEFCAWSTGETIILTREQMQYLLGLRTREMDLADYEASLKE